MRTITESTRRSFIEFVGAPKRNSQKRNWSVQKLAALYKRKYPEKYAAWGVKERICK